uniref:Epimerase domain-containing protein n=1 Tax=Macrostomum lignano TaxID=282301 RepID=A0A1I8F8C0_9PLAT
FRRSPPARWPDDTRQRTRPASALHQPSAAAGRRSRSPLRVRIFSASVSCDLLGANCRGDGGDSPSTSTATLPASSPSPSDFSSSLDVVSSESGPSPLAVADLVAGFAGFVDFDAATIGASRHRANRLARLRLAPEARRRWRPTSRAHGALGAGLVAAAADRMSAAGRLQRGQAIQPASSDSAVAGDGESAPFGCTGEPSANAELRSDRTVPSIIRDHPVASLSLPLHPKSETGREIINSRKPAAQAVSQLPQEATHIQSRVRKRCFHFHVSIGRRCLSRFGQSRAHRSCSSTGRAAPKILITGGLGQLGRGLASRLRARYGRSSVILTDILKPTAAVDGPYRFADILDFKLLQEMIVNERITWMFHFSALLSAVGEQNTALALRVNIEGLHKLRPAALRAPAPSAPSARRRQEIRRRTDCAEAEHHLRSVEGTRGAHGRVLSPEVRPGLPVPPPARVISADTAPGGGTTDYAVHIFHEAIRNRAYKCYLREDTRLPMIYIDDCLRAMVEVMEDPRHMSNFQNHLRADFRQQADRRHHWPQVLDGQQGEGGLGWKHLVDTPDLVELMLQYLSPPLRVQCWQGGQLILRPNEPTLKALAIDYAGLLPNVGSFPAPARAQLLYPV